MRLVRFLALLAIALAASFAEAAEHVVQRGETLAGIAGRYGVSPSDLVRANNLRDANLVRIGQRLTIPESAAKTPPAVITYTVRRGDTVAAIATRHGTTVQEIARLNHLPRPDSIRVGQQLQIPAPSGSAAPAAPAAVAGPRLPADTLGELQAVRAKRDQWTSIVIHHSGTEVGSARGMDNYHRNQRRMENGLAYHFVIGNGRGMGDGEIHVGNRWKRQLEGGHLASYAQNQVSIGICLVGDFEKQVPTAKQLESLEALVRHLQTTLNLPVSSFTTHRLAHPRHTLCPGKRFPTQEFQRRLERGR
jgi:LysM repeat protein